MFRFDNPVARVALPVVCGAVGAVLYILSPLSHQAFCAPLALVPVEADKLPATLGSIPVVPSSITE